MGGGGLQLLNRKKSALAGVQPNAWKRNGVYETLCGERVIRKNGESQVPLIVNTGLVWNAYTGNRVKATTHRVLAQDEESGRPVMLCTPENENKYVRERFSHAFFLNPNWKDTL